MEDQLASLFATIALPAIFAGIFGGVLAGLLGVGGGIVIVPALYFALSLTEMDPAQVMQVSVGTSLATIIFTSLRSVRSHALRDSVDFGVLRSWAPWVVGGTMPESLFVSFVE